MKTVAYDYLFNYFGGDTFNGKIITGVAITLAIRPLRNGKEVKFKDKTEPSTHEKYFCDVFDVSFDRENLFIIKRNLYIDNLFRIVFGFDEIKYEIIDFTLDYFEGKTREVFPNLDIKEIDNLPVCTPMNVSEAEFRNFISSHIDDFDISDNQKAQCPSVSFI